MVLSKKLLTMAIVSSLGGFLFGFDTAVISGAEQGLKEFFNLNTISHGFTNSIALIGTIIGAIFDLFQPNTLGEKILIDYWCIFWDVCFRLRFYQ